MQNTNKQQTKTKPHSKSRGSRFSAIPKHTDAVNIKFYHSYHFQQQDRFLIHTCIHGVHQRTNTFNLRKTKLNTRNTYTSSLAANTTALAAEISPSDHCGFLRYIFCRVLGSPSSFCSLRASCTSILTAPISVVQASRILPFTSSLTSEPPARVAASMLYGFEYRCKKGGLERIVVESTEVSVSLTGKKA